MTLIILLSLKNSKLTGNCKTFFFGGRAEKKRLVYYRSARREEFTANESGVSFHPPPPLFALPGLITQTPLGHVSLNLAPVPFIKPLNGFIYF